MQTQIAYTVKREFLGKITTEELVKKIIKSHKDSDNKKKAS